MRDVYQFYKGLVSVKKAHSARRKRTIHVRVDVWVEDAVSDSIITLIKCSVFHSTCPLTIDFFLFKLFGIEFGVFRLGHCCTGENGEGRVGDGACE